MRLSHEKARRKLFVFYELYILSHMVNHLGTGVVDHISLRARSILRKLCRMSVLSDRTVVTYVPLHETESGSDFLKMVRGRRRKCGPPTPVPRWTSVFKKFLYFTAFLLFTKPAERAMACAAVISIVSKSASSVMLSGIGIVSL